VATFDRKIDFPQNVKILILTDFGKKKRRRFDGEEIKKNVT